MSLELIAVLIFMRLDYHFAMDRAASCPRIGTAESMLAEFSSPNGEPWLRMCIDGGVWRKYSYVQTRDKVARVFRHLRAPGTPPGVSISRYWGFRYEPGGRI